MESPRPEADGKEGVGDDGVGGDGDQAPAPLDAEELRERAMIAQFKASKVVELLGLETKPELNGTRGVLFADYDPKTARVKVMCDYDKKLRAIRLANLVMLAEQPKPAAPPEKNPLLGATRVLHLDEELWARNHGDEEEEARISWNNHETTEAAIRDAELRARRALGNFELSPADRLDGLLALAPGPLKDALLPYLTVPDAMYLLNARLRAHGAAVAVDDLTAIGVTPGEHRVRNRRGQLVTKKYPIINRRDRCLSEQSAEAAQAALEEHSDAHHGNMQRLVALLFQREYGEGGGGASVADANRRDLRVHVNLSNTSFAGGVDELRLLRSYLVGTIGMANLQSLKLRNCDIDEEGARLVASVLSVNGAMLKGHHEPVSWDGMKVEGLTLGTVAIAGRLTKVDLRGNDFCEGGGAVALCAALNCNPTLQCFNGRCHEDKVTIDAAEEFEGGMRIYDTCFLAQRMRFNGITCLDLSNSFVTGRYPFGQLAGFRALVSAMKVSETLIDVNLSYCHLFAQGTALVMDMLETNDTITSLNLSQNDLGPQGAAHLLRFLNRSARASSATVLRHLDLTMNNIHDKQKAKLCEFTRSHGCLVHKH